MTAPISYSASSGERAEHIRELAAALAAAEDPAAIDGLVNAMAHSVAECVLSADGAAMEAAATELRIVAGRWEGRTGDDGWSEQRGRLYGFVDVLRWILERRTVDAGVKSVEPGSHAHRMLALLAEYADAPAERLNGRAIAERLRVDKTEVSRTGRELIESGLATTHSLGRKTFWEITPRGEYVLERLPEPVPAAPMGRRLALQIGDVTDQRAEELAVELAGEHAGVTACVVSSRATESGSRGKRRPIMVLEVERGAGVRLDDIEREAEMKLGATVTQLALVPAMADQRVYTVLPATAAAARRVRRQPATR